MLRKKPIILAARKHFVFVASLFIFSVLRINAGPTFANAVTNGIIDIPKLTEASGIAESRNNANVIWTENDSGNAAVVYAIDNQGRLLGTYVLPSNTDNEDLGIGPGPVTNVSYLYVTDIGDNNVNRTNIAIYQAPEPTVYAGKQVTVPLTNAPMKGMRTIFLTYPDGAHNAEAEFADPISGDWFIITKDSTGSIYTAPKSLMDTSTNIMLKYVEPLNFDVANGADISPLGDEIVVRQENFAQLWARTNGEAITNALAGPYTSIPVQGIANGEPNGEAIGFDYYGSGYFTISDSESKGIQPLRYFARTSADGPTPPTALVPMAASWKYLANGSNQGTTWQSPAFSDSAWSTGTAQLGYGGSNVQTIVSYGPSSSSKYITTYFRNTFSVTNASRIAALTLKLAVNDGALVYLNGSPVTNLNLAFGAAYNTTATAMTNTLRDTWQSFPVNPDLVVEGTNVIAAEVHLASGTATNLVFDLQLNATVAPAITTVTPLANSQQKLTLAGSSNSPTTIQATTNFTTWTTLGSLVLTNSNGMFTDSLAPNFPMRFYRAYRAVP